MGLVNFSFPDWQSIQNDVNFISYKSQHLSIFRELVKRFLGLKVSSNLLIYTSQSLKSNPSLTWQDVLNG